ncbi:tRNA1(Val) (adenine(37)-N6)-methyltransferase [Ligilactobacillus aviarius]|uniref:Methyltransferase n=1 Tax=Ligilactobacillus aviarius TaxID=1606 RepID=A0A179CH03_9LACO|nr:tRNA1(Val) (adenine(37)-N6)-methyltransferase [Ligilactobacillus aviarius]OAP98628.1 methyltransferase [Ligilactobacillus aviarius]OAP98748.1 methyltransferase [Ligilactobacillus aviarius]OAP99870.1 methyltransferase [Ligilactobacillus aviarius]OAQ02143.1 methyltransferase [Ligilactobacillus aviarius]OAQ04368.1 methyltransferase [Ligilactobacillus aviarius]
MEKVKLYENERVDSLLAENLQIIQSADVFSFSLDAVLLADFVKPVNRPDRKAVDLCAGNGAVGLFISKKFAGQIDQVEIQSRLADMNQRSLELNGLTDRIKVYNRDLKDAFSFLEKDSYDVVTCNPPYFKTLPQSKKNPNQYLALARHEIAVTLEDTVEITSGLLKTGGKAYYVHRPDRLIEILDTMQAHRLAPKRIKLIYPKQGRDANMVLIEAIKDGKSDGLKFLPPVITYTDQNEYTPTIKEILYGK